VARLTYAQADGAQVRTGLHARKKLPQSFKGVGLQAMEQGIHGVIIPCVTPHLSFSWLDLHRLSDYSLDTADLQPLMLTLADDLGRQNLALSQALDSGADAQTLHQILHALKGMAGLFAVPAMQAALTRADDACRQGQWASGATLARSVQPALNMWEQEVGLWLQRYS
jgi:HPt (histidine-containing phosphotransfer) domain-containing protein